MEIKASIFGVKKMLRHICCTLLLLMMAQLCCVAQTQVKAYSIKDGKMYIMLSKKLSDAALDSFIVQYNLYDLDLKNFMKTNSMDSLSKLKWELELNNSQYVAISKKMTGSDNFDNPADNISLAEKQRGSDLLFPAVSNNIRYGYNRFKNKPLFVMYDSVVVFFARNYKKAKQVVLAGSFNNWSEDSLYMSRTDSGWEAKVTLAPGKYWYKFIVDGDWQVDKDNLLDENDGMGNNNSVFYKPNFILKSRSFTTAGKVFLAGSFNDWKPGELQMLKAKDGWILPLYLADGTYTYRYIVDGVWQADPENNEKLPNEYNEYNSVIRIGKQYKIKLDGYTTAAKVQLAGSFNNWKENELQMNKTAAGWELDYTLGPGNYDYSFKVDGQWIASSSTPGNPLFTSQRENALFSNIIIEPNYTFHLKGFESAKKVFLAGDFNNWSPDTYLMKKTGNEWVIDIHLTKGKHRYKFLADGKWVLDPANKLWEQNEYGTGNSVLWLEK